MEIPIPTRSLVHSPTVPAFALCIAADSSVHITQATRALILTRSPLICPSRHSGWLPHTEPNQMGRNVIRTQLSALSARRPQIHINTTTVGDHLPTSATSLEPHVPTSAITLEPHVHCNLTFTGTSRSLEPHVDWNLTLTGTSRSQQHRHVRTSHSPQHRHTGTSHLPHHSRTSHSY